VPCPQCGRPVELFKDEASARCPGCGHRFRNLRASFDCAQWCAYAEECVGFVPERRASSDPGQGAVASRLIQTVKQELSGSPARLARALTAFQHARELLLSEGGDPRVILASSLLLDLPADPTKATQILQDAGLDEDTIANVCHLLESYRAGRDLDMIEFRVVQDADTLTKLAEGDGPGDPEKLQEVVTRRLKTSAAKAKARSLYTPRSQAQPGNALK
jgi:hypothetical protein